MRLYILDTQLSRMVQRLYFTFFLLNVNGPVIKSSSPTHGSTCGVDEMALPAGVEPACVQLSFQLVRSQREYGSINKQDAFYATSALPPCYKIGSPERFCPADLTICRAEPLHYAHRKLFLFVSEKSLSHWVGIPPFIDFACLSKFLQASE